MTIRGTPLRVATLAGSSRSAAKQSQLLGGDSILAIMVPLTFFRLMPPHATRLVQSQTAMSEIATQSSLADPPVSPRVMGDL